MCRYALASRVRVLGELHIRNYLGEPMKPNGEIPKDVQREANVLQVQRWWEEHQESGAVSVRSTEELIRVAILETVAPELLVDPPTPQQLVLL